MFQNFKYFFYASKCHEMFLFDQQYITDTCQIKISNLCKQFWQQHMKNHMKKRQTVYWTSYTCPRVKKLLDSSSTIPEIRSWVPYLSKLNFYFQITFENNPNKHGCYFVSLQVRLWGHCWLNQFVCFFTSCPWDLEGEEGMHNQLLVENCLTGKRLKQSERKIWF